MSIGDLGVVPSRLKGCSEEISIWISLLFQDSDVTDVQSICAWVSGLEKNARR